ncbi:mannitol dehydrogenase family protein [Herbiconiux sp. KACC 21604]|uniref:mannitol dehydrogenase family protein n=1 Tax=unclassified Herbiconiux TaxID=2618217 RepID=UPI001492A714|nr:mannitol dehydrogenase family protein [Herbiconiux sp. SALV-R1]QJU53111.1 mannitol dehydrogenase family protein [Herbiconiux sp. SALV-R1]WPO88050.1 mannitol dehydrogenase family protein [Herbiconiux sp. KACC 21604]
MTILNAATVGSLDSTVAVPAYDRGAVRPGIVHFGVGAFHRAHEAMFVDRLLGAADAATDDWGIIGVGTLAGDAAMRDALAAQDGLYTLVTTAPSGEVEARVIGSLVRYLFAPEEGAAVVDALRDPAIRIVSLTITEGGYGINDATGAFEPSDAATLADLDVFVGHKEALTGEGAYGAHPLDRPIPTSALGFIVRGLADRRAAGEVPFTVMSCDNIQGNGRVARAAVLAFAQRIDQELAEWIATEVAFPNSMVDRITPATTEESRERVAREFGIDDRWPVLSESFVQWVLEDSFTAGRPPFDEVGVQIVPEVEPYELMKLRLLNASHQAMSYLGLLAGAEYVHEVCRDELFAGFLLSYMTHEARPTLDPVPGVDLDEYSAELMRRFGSEAIADTLMRQIVDGSERIPKFLLPVVRAQLASGGQIERSVLVLAAWSRFIEGVADDGSTLHPVDRRLPELQDAVAGEKDAPGSFLDYTPVFGDLGSDPRLRGAFVEARARLAELGARGALEALRR